MTRKFWLGFDKIRKRVSVRLRRLKSCDDLSLCHWGDRAQSSQCCWAPDGHCCDEWHRAQFRKTETAALEEDCEETKGAARTVTRMDRELLIDVEGPPGLFAVFEEDAKRGGYQYLYEPNGAGIIRHLKIYDPTIRPLPEEDDIEVMWSSDLTKCGVVIWGRMRGVMDVVRGEDLSIRLESKESPAIVAPEWLMGFDNYLDQRKFVRARKKYWKGMARRYRDQHQRHDAHRAKGEGNAEENQFNTNFVAY